MAWARAEQTGHGRFLVVLVGVEGCEVDGRGGGGGDGG